MKQTFLKIDRFFTHFECGDLIARHSADLGPLGTLGQPISRHRVADGKWFSNDDEDLVRRFKILTSAITGVPISHQESPHLVRYQVGGEYKTHFDYFIPGTEHYESHTRYAGQRLFSTILYLNDNFLGGETDFPNVGVKIKPETGMVYTWRNVSIRGELEPLSFHAGLPVTEGVKYILIIWTRERPFVHAGSPEANAIDAEIAARKAAEEAAKQPVVPEQPVVAEATNVITFPSGRQA
jgi:prolyl 4-hydroxylase